MVLTQRTLLSDFFDNRGVRKARQPVLTTAAKPSPAMAGLTVSLLHKKTAIFALHKSRSSVSFPPDAAAERAVPQFIARSKVPSPGKLVLIFSNLPTR